MEKKKVALAAALVLVVSLAGRVAVLSQRNAAAVADNAAPAAAEAPGHVRGELLVRFKDDVPAAEAARFLESRGYGVKGEIESIGVKVISVPEGAEEKLAAALSKSPKLEFAEVNGLMELEAGMVVNDPEVLNGRQFLLDKIRAPEAWSVTPGSAGAVVAILDTGANLAHPDLVGNLVPGYDLYNGDSDPSDDVGHGTAVAGVSAAQGNNGIGVAGVAWDASVMPLKVCYPSGSSGFCTWSAAASGLTYAADRGARVANMSFGNNSISSTLQNAISYAWKKNVVLVAAAGNDGASALFYPAAFPNVLAVSALDSSDVLRDWSNYGSWVDLAAYGSGLYSTTGSGGYGYFSGTSFSSPMVAGVAALVAAANPSLTNAQIVSILTSTADDFGPAGFDVYYGYGRVNAYAAVLAATGGTLPPGGDLLPPYTVLTAPAAGATVSGTVALAASATDAVGVTKVEFYQNNAFLLGADTSAPYTASWDTASAGDGIVSFSSRAYDAAGNVGKSVSVSVTIANGTATPGDTSSPAVSVTAPAAGATVSGTVAVAAAASDNVGVTKVEFYRDGLLLGADTSAPYSASWDTASAADGPHALSARAYDAAGNVGTSASVSVTVANVPAAPDTAPPTITSLSPAAGTTLKAKGNLAIGATAADNVAVTQIKLLFDGVTRATCTNVTTCSASVSLNKLAAGAHTVAAVARDAAGNYATSTNAVSK